MSENARDRELGMYRPITRRDFLSGTALALGAALVRPRWLGALETAPAAAYPPALTGLRGDHAGSFEVAHALRDGKTFDDAASTGERYDLIVVGGGLSGLAAAWFFREAAGPRARILVLDNHDDFGGHAKRNEFRRGERTLIGYGGTQSLDAPSTFTAEGKELLAAIGVDARKFYAAFDQELYHARGLNRAVFFDRETFGQDRLVVGEPPGAGGRGPYAWAPFLAKTPLPEKARADLRRLFEEPGDALPGLSLAEKSARLRKTSYRDFLLRDARVEPLAAAYLHARAFDDIALGSDAYSAWWAFHHGLAGFDGLGLGAPAGVRADEPYIFHFPDGNAGVARLLVRALIPKALPGRTMEDSVTARLDYGALDREGWPVRVRLSATAVRVRHVGEPATASEVEVTYVQDGRARRVSAGACVLACDNAMIPYLCPELPERQKEALKLASRAPLVYTTVLLRDSTALQKLGVCEMHCPGSFHSDVSLDFPVSLGDYRASRAPEEPVLLHLLRVPLTPGKPAREQFKDGRAELLSTTFETFERRTRDQLARALAAGGFDPARDIEAVTVNRWPHGYAMGQNSLFDPDWSDEEAPWVVGRKRFGRVAVANSDAAAIPLTQAAIDQAHRAVDELRARAFPYGERL